MRCENVICHFDEDSRDLEKCATCEELTDHIHSIPDPNHLDRIDLPMWRICNLCHEDMLRIWRGETPQRFSQIELRKKE